MARRIKARAADDERWMAVALKLARRGRGHTLPNPVVGAVIVDRRGEVIARGFHRRYGGDHAEVAALGRAGAMARGSTLYVNLEPCNHVGRTGPCSEAIIAAGIKRVVVGMVDPNPLVDGGGIRALRRAGLAVDVGVLGERCAAENRPFCTFIRAGRPHVTFKAAMTLDGRVATRGGDSRWVTGDAARRRGHRLRSEHQAIVVGLGTVLRDDPQLTCRLRGGRDPLRVIVDSALRTPPKAQVVQGADRSSAETWIVTTRDAPEGREARLRAAGVRVIRVAAKRGRVSLLAMLRRLQKEDVASLLLEGGPTLAGSFWRQGLVDDIVAFVAPKILGDPQALPILLGAEAKRIDLATSLGCLAVRRVGDDLMISATVSHETPAKRLRG